MKILLLLSLVVTTYSTEFGRSVNPWSYNLFNSSYFAINVGISDNSSNFLILSDPNNINDDKLSGKLALPWQEGAVKSLNILSIAQALIDINVILRTSSPYMYVSWHAMIILRQWLYHYHFKKYEGIEAINFFFFLYHLPTLTFDIPHIALRIDIAQFVFYFGQIKDINNSTILGMLLSSVRLYPKIFKNYGDAIIAKFIDLAFAVGATYCLKDCEFNKINNQYWFRDWF